MPINLRELRGYRERLYFFTWRGIKMRYKQMLLGFGWGISCSLFPCGLGEAFSGLC